MRRLAFILFNLTLSALSAQENSNTFFLFEEGAEWEYQTLDKKGKLVATQELVSFKK